MDFTEIENPWSSYVLPDGRRLRVRHILIQVERHPFDVGTDGDPPYNLTFSAIAVITEPITAGDQANFDLADGHDAAANALGVAMEMPLCPVKKSDL